MTATRRRAALALAVSLTAGVSVLQGCLINSHSAEDLSGKYVSTSTFGQIEPGVTRRDWVMATLGEPTNKSTCDDGSEIWKYSYSKRQSSSGSVLFVFGGSSVKETAGTAYVQMKDGVVTKAWRAED